ncbi:MAG: PilZ domain-containing protein [Deltaproteobacteria bacterium]|nr:PilZ domain-containing protein [Deltaproteobacteria bacterium]
MSKKQEARKHVRYEVDAYVDYTGTDVGLYHKVQNISLGGICIQSSSVEDVGTIVDLVINFPDLDSTIAIKGEVVWANRHEPKDMGIRYMNLDDGRLGTLKKFIQKVKK